MCAVVTTLYSLFTKSVSRIFDLSMLLQRGFTNELDYYDNEEIKIMFNCV